MGTILFFFKIRTLNKTILQDLFNVLAEYGWGDGVLLLEQGELGGGTSTHATGLMGILKPSAIETRIAIISRDLYRYP